MLRKGAFFCEGIFINGKDIKIGQKSGNLDSNIVSKGGKSHTDFYHKHGIGFF